LETPADPRERLFSGAAPLLKFGKLELTADAIVTEGVQVDHFALPSFCDGVDPPAPDDVA
jgi:hypothetical protein